MPKATFDANAIYKRMRTKPTKYREEIHCPLILNIMKKKGRLSAFCVESEIGESTFYDWCSAYPIFYLCYSLGKMIARESWEEEGEEIKHIVSEPGTSNNRLQCWQMMGWSRFGVGKNSRIRLNLSQHATPSQHYGELLKQAGDGDFTAGEIKQLMEAINVGLRAHEVFELQKQIDELKSDVINLNEIKHGENTYTNKGIT